MKWLFFLIFIINSQELLCNNFEEKDNRIIKNSNYNDHNLDLSLSDGVEGAKYNEEELYLTESINTVFDNIPSELCVGVSYVLPTVSDDSITGSWSPILDTSIVSVVRYTFTPDEGQGGEIVVRDITVSSSIIPVFNDIFPNICQGDPFVLPTTSDNLIKGSWSAMLDTSILTSESYLFTPDAGQCGEQISFRITVQPLTRSIFNTIPSELCVDSSYILPTTSNNSIEGIWSPILDTSIEGVTEYTFIPNRNQCGEMTTHSITIVSSRNTIFDNIPSELCVGDPYVLPTVSDNSIEGTWFPILDTSIVGSVVYTFTPDINQCGMPIQHIIELIDFNEIEIPVFFTPNNDGVNDYWKIEGGENIQNIRVSIFDRFGTLLKAYDPDIGWDGISKGVKMPPNDYWYLIEGIDTSCKVMKRKGHFSLLRN